MEGSSRKLWPSDPMGAWLDLYSRVAHASRGTLPGRPSAPVTRKVNSVFQTGKSQYQSLGNEADPSEDRG